MPNWKKVIVSGSDASLNSITTPAGTINSLTASYAMTASFINVTGSNAFVQNGNSFGATAVLGTNDNQSLAFETSGSTRMFVSSSGIIGIGTSTPAYTLDAPSGSLRFVTLAVGNDAAGSATLSTSGNYMFVAGNNNHDVILPGLFALRSGAGYGVGIQATQYPAVATSAILTLTSTTKGLLTPRTNLTSNISAPAQGLLTYITSSATEGLYYYNSGSYQAWTRLLNDSGSQILSGSLTVTGSVLVNTTNPTLGQFVGNTNGYSEFSVRNTNTGISASGDIAVYADTGTTTNNYIDMGINNSGLSNSYFYGGTDFGNALDAYVYNVGGNLRIGNATSQAPYSQSFYLFSNPSATPDITITGSKVGIGISSSMNAKFTVYGSGSTVMSILGSQGELFSITDSLSGSLFSVNDISGLPVLEAFSDNTVLMGSYIAPSLNTTTKTTTPVGSNTIYTIPTASYTGAFFEYTAVSASNARAGSIMAIHNGGTVRFTETTTTDIGTTAGLAFTVIQTGGNIALTGSSTTAGWTIKTIVRSI